MSVIKHEGQRVGVFIDTQNLYHSARNIHHAKVNFGAIVEEAVGDRTLIRAIAYVITTESGEEQGFFEALEKVGIETKTKNLQIFSGGAKKADWDVGLAVDAIKMAPKLDTVILVSGDGDFVPLVEYLKVNEGCQVEVIAFGESSSKSLRDVADDFIDLSEDSRKFLLGGAAHGARRERGEGGRGDKRMTRGPRRAPVGGKIIHPALLERPMEDEGK